MLYFYVDLETTVNGGPTGESPEAQWQRNRCLLAGWCTSEDQHIHTGDPVACINALNALISRRDVCLVAHNAKFDIKWLMRYDRECNVGVDWKNLKVWDTMTWQYRYNGHQSRTPSLMECVEFYDIQGKKTLDLDAILASGIKMEQIPHETLDKYLRVDVELLKRVHYNQVLKREEYDMDYILPLSDMELNGLIVDLPRCKSLHSDLSKDIDIYVKEMQDYIVDNCEWQDGSPIDPSVDFSDQLGVKSKHIKPFANRTVSFLLFGEPFQCKITPKWRLRHKASYNIPINPARWYSEDPTHIGYPLDEDKLSTINSTSPHGIINLVLAYRLDSKLDGTYIGPFVQTATIQGCIYPKLNTAITGTGRLSSSQPNGQNMPVPARQLIIPESDEHRVEELDFSQLELVACAAVTEDPTLIDDLKHGRDIHKETATMVFGAAQAEAKRKLAKNVNFGVLYGGKAPGLSKQTGVDQAVIQQLIDAFFTRYPQVAKKQKAIYEEVIDNMRPLDVKDGEQRYRSDWILPITGRKFRFVETEAPMWLRKKLGRKWSFSPNHTANYPIQGFAGGDLTLSVLTWLWKHIQAMGIDVTFRMTVHDSIVITKHKNIDLVGWYDKACYDVGKKFGLPVPLTYDVETGSTWQ